MIIKLSKINYNNCLIVSYTDELMMRISSTPVHRTRNSPKPSRLHEKYTLESYAYYGNFTFTNYLILVLKVTSVRVFCKNRKKVPSVESLTFKLKISPPFTAHRSKFNVFPTNSFPLHRHQVYPKS